MTVQLPGIQFVSWEVTKDGDFWILEGVIASKTVIKTTMQLKSLERCFESIRLHDPQLQLDEKSLIEQLTRDQ